MSSECEAVLCRLCSEDDKHFPSFTYKEWQVNRRMVTMSMVECELSIHFVTQMMAVDLGVFVLREVELTGLTRYFACII